MNEYVIALTENLHLFTGINDACNENGWFVCNTTTINDLKKNLLKRDPIGIIWDLEYEIPAATLKDLKNLRKNFRDPIIVLAKEKDIDYEVKLFETQVNDYITAPFDYSDIAIRLKQQLQLKMLLHKPENSFDEADEDSAFQERIFELNGITLCLDSFRAIKDGKDLQLTPKEFKLLDYLAKHCGQVLSREQLLQGVWGYDILGTSRIVDIHISHLRDKLEADPNTPLWIKTNRGFGYSFASKIKIKA